MSKSTWVRTPELDAFGPWILAVTSDDEVPPLFRGVDLAGARLVLKVPRPLERRTVRAGMDLYDRLVLVRDDGLEVLVRAPQVPQGFERRWLRAADLIALEDSTAMLDGLLRLHVAGGPPLEVPYNGSSADMVARLVGQIRDFWRARPAMGRPSPERLPIDALGPADVGLVNHLADLQARDPQLEPVLARSRHRAVRRGGGRILDRAWPVALQAAVVCTTGSELVVVHRRSWLARGFETALSLATTVVPLTRGVRAEVVDHPAWPGLRLVRLLPTDVTLVAAAGDGLADEVARLLRGA